MRLPLLAVLTTIAAALPALAADHREAPALTPLAIATPAPTSSGQTTPPTTTFQTELIQMELRGD